jgi:hypothetical protein
VSRPLAEVYADAVKVLEDVGAAKDICDVKACLYARVCPGLATEMLRELQKSQPRATGKCSVECAKCDGDEITIRRIAKACGVAL